jgi:hypothetical protein
MELAYFASLYHRDGVLEGCRLVKAMSEGFIDQRAGRCVVPALTSMDLCEHGHVSLCQTGDPISGCTVIRKDVVL